MHLLIFLQFMTDIQHMKFKVRKFESQIEPDLFDNNVPFDNTTPIYPINLLWKLWLELGLDLELHCFSIFHGE